MYDVESLKSGIEKKKNNIKIFEEAIEKERAEINEYYNMIEVIERKEREATNNIVKIEVERDD